MIKLSDLEYFSIDAVSQSGINQFLKSPAHYKLWKFRKPEQTSAMKFGSAVHCAFLEPDRFEAAYTYSDLDKRTKLFKEFEEKNKDKIILTQNEMETILGMRSVFQQSKYKDLLSEHGSATEQAVIWTDKESGLKCKAKIDYMNIETNTLLDLKTTTESRPEIFIQHAARLGYHVQAAFYKHALEISDLKVDHVKLLVMEKEAPFVVAVYNADKALLEKGTDLFRQALIGIKYCEENNYWPMPNYTEEEQLLKLPDWA
jgi:hypothetical protein